MHPKKAIWRNLSIMENKEYLDLIKKTMPKTNEWSTLIRAFLCGGLVCCFAEGLKDLYTYLIPTATTEDVASYVTITLIFITVLLTGLGIYDKAGEFAGAGLFIPITGFANAVASSSIESNKEGIILGLCTKMFYVAGPIIVFGIVASVVVGALALIFPGWLL